MARVYIGHMTAALQGCGPPSVRCIDSKPVELRYDNPTYPGGWALVVCGSCGNHYDVFVLSNRQRRAQYRKSRKITACIGAAITAISTIATLVAISMIKLKGSNLADSVFVLDSSWTNWFELSTIGIIVGLMVLIVASVLKANEIHLELRSGTAPNRHVGRVD